MAEVPDQIWSDDLLGRRQNADELQQFLVQRSQTLLAAGRLGAYTLAIDGQYGSGKSYLLRRLHRQICLDHPAAFIDAWADDTIDAPWTALLVALEEALKPFAALISPATRANLKDKGAQLITALAKGAAKKGASYLIGDEGWDDAVDAVFEREAENKIGAYRDRRKAIEQLKETLRKAVSELAEQEASHKPPLFVFVDELDRCRPTYAVRFLEEIKHIFDVSGVVFVLAIHRKQLLRAIESLYGSGFDAEDYLRRFVDKHYVLFEPEMLSLVQYHANAAGLRPDRFGAPQNDPLEFIAASLGFWTIHPRDAIRVIDSLATCEALWPHPVRLRLEYLLPLVVLSVLNISKAELEGRQSTRRVPTYRYHRPGGPDTRNPKEIFDAFSGARNHDFYFYQDDSHRVGIGGDIARVFDEELQLRRPVMLKDKSLLALYPTLVKSLSRLKSE